MSYATTDDVYQLALTARAFVVVASPILLADAPTGTIRLQAHGYGAADRLLFSVTSGGVIPPEVSPFTYYSPIVLGDDLFQIANPSTLAPITFSVAPKGWAVAVSHVRRLTAHLRETAAQIDNCLTAHATPILVDPVTGLYPAVLVGINARMAARSAVASLQLDNAAYREPIDRLKASEAADILTLAEWRLGKSILPTPVDQNVIADMGPRARGRCPIPWQRGTL